MSTQKPLCQTKRFELSHTSLSHSGHFMRLLNPIIRIPVCHMDGFRHVEGIALSSVLSLQSACINGSEFITPEANRLATDGDASLGQKVLDIAVNEIESL
jgi:hypothetical protein